MSDRPSARDAVLNYKPGEASELPLDPGEPLLAVFSSDRRIYRRDHALVAGLGIVAVAAVLAWLGKAPQIPVAALGVVAAVALRGAILQSEQMARRWRLTDRRLLSPQGRQIMLPEIATVRRLFGDVQIVHTSGEKHLIKYLADGPAAIETILAAKAKRAKPRK